MKAKSLHKRRKRAVVIENCSGLEASLKLHCYIGHSRAYRPRRALWLSGISEGELSPEFYKDLSAVCWPNEIAVIDTNNPTSLFNGDRVCAAISKRRKLKSLWLTVPGITQTGIDAVPPSVRQMTLSLRHDVTFERFWSLRYLSIYADDKLELSKETAQSLRSLRFLDLNGRGPVLKFLDGLSDVHSLRKIAFCSSYVFDNDQVLTRLRRIVNLEWLTMPDIPGDAQTDYLSGCLSALTHLHLTSVCDVERLQVLMGLTRLRRLYVSCFDKSSWRADCEFIVKLRKRLPNCRIYLSC